MFKPYLPHFNYPTHRDAMAQYSQRIELTVEGARHYNEAYSTDALKPGQVLGYFRRADNGIEVFSHTGHFMGPCEGQLLAAEELLRLAVRRATTDSVKAQALKVA